MRLCGLVFQPVIDVFDELVLERHHAFLPLPPVGMIVVKGGGCDHDDLTVGGEDVTHEPFHPSAVGKVGWYDDSLDARGEHVITQAARLFVGAGDVFTSFMSTSLLASVSRLRTPSSAAGDILVSASRTLGARWSW